MLRVTRRLRQPRATPPHSAVVGVFLPCLLGGSSTKSAVRAQGTKCKKRPFMRCVAKLGSGASRTVPRQQNAVTTCEVIISQLPLADLRSQLAACPKPPPNDARHLLVEAVAVVMTRRTLDVAVLRVATHTSQGKHIVIWKSVAANKVALAAHSERVDALGTIAGATVAASRRHCTTRLLQHRQITEHRAAPRIVRNTLAVAVGLITFVQLPVY